MNVLFKSKCDKLTSQLIHSQFNWKYSLSVEFACIESVQLAYSQSVSYKCIDADGHCKQYFRGSKCQILSYWVSVYQHFRGQSWPKIQNPFLKKFLYQHFSNESMFSS